MPVTNTQCRVEGQARCPASTEDAVEEAWGCGQNPSLGVWTPRLKPWVASPPHSGTLGSSSTLSYFFCKRGQRTLPRLRLPRPRGHQQRADQGGSRRGFSFLDRRRPTALTLSTLHPPIPNKRGPGSALEFPRLNARLLTDRCFHKGAL